MAKTWEEYYDYYLDGKPAPEPSDAKEKGEGKAKQKMKKAAEAKEAGKSAASSPADLFELRDVDKNDNVTWAEFLSGRTGPTVPALEQRFKNFDRDGDGTWRPRH